MRAVNVMSLAIEEDDLSLLTETQVESRVWLGLQHVRGKVQKENRARFTTLLQHITPRILKTSFYALKESAGARGKGGRWREYEQGLATRLKSLHKDIRSGKYPLPSSQPATGLAALEDKIVQRAVCSILLAIYEEEFLGCGAELDVDCGDRRYAS